MTFKYKLLFSLIFIFVFIVPVLSKSDNYQELKKEIAGHFYGLAPMQWAEIVPGVKTKLCTDKKVIAFTFDACGCKNNDFNKKLIKYLIKEQIPATLFITGRWIDKYPQYFKKLANNILFEIENHGLNHKPCSVNGNSAYGIKGTVNINELIDEIELNARKIETLTGRKPKFYRSGTAFYDEVAVKIINALGYEAIGFSIIGDAGASYTAKQIKDALLNSEPGTIIICHMNHPKSQIVKGIMAALPELRNRGFSFVKLSDYPLK